MAIWLIVVFSIVGVSRWIKERAHPPSPPKREPASAESAASGAIPESGAEEEPPAADDDTPRPIPEEERRQAERVAESSSEGSSRCPKAIHRKPWPMRPAYVSRSYYEAIRESMKVDEPRNIRELTLWPVEPPLLEGGLSFQVVVVTEDGEELHLWFSMKKDGKRWIVWRREEGFR